MTWNQNQNARKSAKNKNANNDVLALPDPPKDYLIFNILATVFCGCWPIGIFAILRSVETKDAIAVGNREQAQASSRSAKTFGIITLAVGMIFTVVSVAVTACYIQTTLNA